MTATTANFQRLVAAAVLGGAAMVCAQAQEPSMADKAGSAASSAATRTGHAIHRGAHATAEAASSTGHAIHRGATKTGDAIVDGAESASAAVKHGVHKAHNKMKAASEAQ